MLDNLVLSVCSLFYYANIDGGSKTVVSLYGGGARKLQGCPKE